MQGKTLSMILDFKSGLTCAQVGHKYSCSRQAVQQRLAYHGVSKDMGGLALRKGSPQKNKQLDSMLLLAKRILKSYKCSVAEYNKITGGRNVKESKAYEYQQQGHNAHKRGIPFRLSFPEWNRVWEASGHYAQRGKRLGQYVMSRKGDAGPYALGNVVIKTVTDNIKERKRH
jgi:hypothetical protein